MAHAAVQAADEEHRRRRVPHAKDVFSGSDECVSAALHRHRAGVACTTLEDPLSAHDAHDSHREPERGTRSFQDGTLLDVHLEETARKLIALDECGAADAAALLFAKDHYGAGADALDCLDA